MEKNLMRVPLVRRVYPYIKQVTDFFLAKKSLEFSKGNRVRTQKSGQ
jgi:uncharacterized membrane protein